MTDSTAGEEAHAHHRWPTRPFAPRHICRLQLSFSAGQGTVSSSLTLHGRPVTCQPADVARHGGVNPCPGGTRRVLTNAMDPPADDVVLALVVAETVGRILSTAQGCIAPLPTSQRCQLACSLGHALLTTCAVSPLTVVNHVNLPPPFVLVHCPPWGRASPQLYPPSATRVAARRDWPGFGAGTARALVVRCTSRLARMREQTPAMPCRIQVQHGGGLNTAAGLGSVAG